MSVIPHKSYANEPETYPRIEKSAIIGAEF